VRAAKVRLVVVIAALLALPMQSAQGHGPCNCSFPEIGTGGAKVKIRSPAYKVIINPRAEDFLIGPAGLESAHRPDAPREVLLSLPETKSRRGVTVRVPAAMPPGLYLILVYDGGEGGQHYTWDYFHLLGPESADAGSEDGLDAELIAVGVGGIVLGLVGFALISRRRAARAG
jgi:hypothetical protein